MQINGLNEKDEKSFILYANEILPKMLDAPINCIVGVTKLNDSEAVGYPSQAFNNYELTYKNVKEAVNTLIEFDHNPSVAQKKSFIKNLLNFDGFLEKNFNKDVDFTSTFQFALSTLLNFQINDINHLPLVSESHDLSYMSGMKNAKDVIYNLKESNSRSDGSIKYMLFDAVSEHPLEIKNGSMVRDILRISYSNYKRGFKLDNFIKPLTLEFQTIILEAGLNQEKIVSLIKKKIVEDSFFNKLFFKGCNPDFDNILLNSSLKENYNFNVNKIVENENEIIDKNIKMFINPDSIKALIMGNVFKSILTKEDNAFIKTLKDSEVQQIKSMFYSQVTDDNLKSVETFRNYKEDVVGISHLSAIELGKFVSYLGWGKESDLPLISEILDSVSKEKLEKISDSFYININNKPDDWVYDFLLNFRNKNPEKNDSFVTSVFESILLPLPLNKAIGVFADSNFEAKKSFSFALEFTEKYKTSGLVEYLTVYVFTKFAKNSMLEEKEKLKNLDSKVYHDAIANIASSAQSWQNSGYDGGKNKMIVCGRNVSNVLIQDNVSYKSLLLILADNLEKKMNERIDYTDINNVNNNESTSSNAFKL